MDVSERLVKITNGWYAYAFPGYTDQDGVVRAKADGKEFFVTRVFLPADYPELYA